MASPIADGIGALADRLLADITSVLVSEESPDRVLAGVADSIRELVPYDSLTVHRIGTSRRLIPVLVRDRPTMDVPAEGPLELGERILGAVAETGVAELIDNVRSEEHTSELQSHSDLVCRLLLE